MCADLAMYAHILLNLHAYIALKRVGCALKSGILSKQKLQQNPVCCEE